MSTFFFLPVMHSRPSGPSTSTPSTPPEPPFSLSGTLSSWPLATAPRFLGKRKVDPPVAEWLASVASGCRERNVPRKHWPVVARALMGEKAIRRLEEFERVLCNMEGKEYKTQAVKKMEMEAFSEKDEKDADADWLKMDEDDGDEPGGYEWTWERFEVAVGSMAWHISGKKTRVFTVAAKKCGLWWVVGKKNESSAGEAPSDSSSLLSNTAIAVAPGSPSTIMDVQEDQETMKKTKKSNHTKFFTEPGSFFRDNLKDKSQERRQASEQDNQSVPKSVDDQEGTATVRKVRKTPIRAMSDSLASAVSSLKAGSSSSSTTANRSSRMSTSSDDSDSNSNETSSTPASSSTSVSSTTLVTTDTKTKSSTSLVHSPPTPRRANTSPPSALTTPGVQTTITHAPDWLVSSLGALDFLTSNHPRTMTALSAVLLAAGSVPALAATGGVAAAFPALAATTGGHAMLCVLGSGTAQAVGAVVSGLGSWIKVVNEGGMQVSK